MRIGFMSFDDKSASHEAHNLCGSAWNALQSLLESTDLSVALDPGVPMAMYGGGPVLAVTSKYVVVTDGDDFVANSIIEEAAGRLLNCFNAERLQGVNQSVVLTGTGLNSPCYTRRGLKIFSGNKPEDGRPSGIHLRQLPEVAEVEQAVKACQIPLFAGLAAFPAGIFPTEMEEMEAKILSVDEVVNAMCQGILTAVLDPKVSLDAALWVGSVCGIFPRANVEFD